MPNETNGEKRTFNRRARTGWAALVLITVDNYICMFKGIDIAWFKEYAYIVLGVTIGVILGISATDAITTWKSK